jgi:ADP-ribose pyrophosphatase YjhB (NUDIX family)
MEVSPFFAGWRHCPECGSDRLQLDGSKASCPSCGREVYANPAPTASALLVDDEGRVLLARRAGDPGAGLWDLLGGFVDEGEEGLAALRRELREELDVEIEPGEFLGAFPDIYGDDGVYTFNLYWTARIASGEPTLNDELEEIAWFAPDALPPREEFAFSNTVTALETWGGRVRTGRPAR